MHSSPHPLLLTLLSIIPLALTTTSPCQIPNEAAPLTGCPPDTLFVSPTNALANYTTIQDAVLSLPNDTSTRVIVIDAGIYVEQVNVTRIGATTLLGKTTNADDLSANLAHITWSAANDNSTGMSPYPDNSYTATLTVASNLESALTGSGPSGYPVPPETPLGSADFKAYNLNITNDFAPQSAGPSLALSTGFSNASFYGVVFQSYQDTVYVGKVSNVYMASSLVGGQTDYLYGFGTLYISNSTLQLRGCGGGITAWKGSNTTFPNKYGVYISGSEAVAENETVAQTYAGRCALGRPWNSQHRSIFMENELDGTVNPQGYVEWSGHPIIPGQTLLGEYKDTGPGFNLTARQQGNITQELTDDEVAPYRWPKDVFLNPDGSANDLSWIDPDHLVP